MKKYLILVSFLTMTLVSCKSKQGFVKQESASENKEYVTILNGYNNSEIQYKTLYIKSNVDYQDQKQSYSLSADIRIKKDEKILVSVKFLGIIVAKALITPISVEYYDTFNSQYYSGDYSKLSEILGTELDYKKIQNLLTGRAMYDLNKEFYSSSIDKDLHKLENKSADVTKSFYFEEGNFLLKKQQIIQEKFERELLVNYQSFKDYSKGFLPIVFVLKAIYQENQSQIKIEYKKIDFDTDINFPYNVPSGYKRINID